MHHFNQPRRVFGAVLTLVALFLAPRCSQAQDVLPSPFEKASANFQPVTENQIAAARADVQSRMKAVERFVGPQSTNGKRWLTYLQWDDLKAAINAPGGADLRALATTYQKLNRDENGLDSNVFRRLSDSLHRFMHLSQLARQSDQAAYFGSQLDRLKAQLDEYRAQPTNSTAVEIGGRLAFLDSLGVAPELAAAVRREFIQPNAFLDISAKLIAEGAEPINRSEPVTDCILGTSIRSDTHTTGNVGVATIPSRDKAIVEFISDGHTYSKNVGNNGPAVIRSTADTNFTATKRVELTDKAFRATGAHSNATTDTHIHSVAKRGGGLGSRLVSNIGWSRARENERQAERIAADHAEDRINRRFNDELNDKLRDARTRYEDEYRRPLARRGALPEHIRFSSDQDSVNLEIAQASRGQIGASGPPPEAPGGHDMSMRLHESAVNNYTATLLGGATGTQNQPDQDLKFDVKLPQWMKDAWNNRKTDAGPAIDAPFKPYSIRLRDVRPVSIAFADGKLRVTIHISRLKSGEETFTNWDVTGTYVPELSGGGVVLRREGDLEMLPADFKDSLTPRQVAERSNLEKELNARSAQGRGFPMTVEFEPLKPDDALAGAGPLEFNQFGSDGGWLTIAWDRRKK